MALVFMVVILVNIIHYLYATEICKKHTVHAAKKDANFFHLA